jgi:hypothetical protein
VVPAATWRTAATATLHCLTGCAIGEVLGFVIGTAAGFSDLGTIMLAIGLAFVFGYALSMLPLLRAGLAIGVALSTALAADTLSILTMEIVDNLVIFVWPGAMEATLGDLLFWGSLGIALGIAFLAAWPLNYVLIRRGLGHALAHKHHHGDHLG